ncbi:MAG: SCO family protein [Acidiferrobacterales bacterium]
MRRPIFVAITLVAFALGVGGGYLWQQRSQSALQLQRATVLVDSARRVPDFQLQDHDRRRFTREQLNGRWTLLFFGYTHCPDICPLTLAQAKDFYRRLEGTPFRADTQVIFVSVDPKRDHPGTLKRYVGYFDPDFVGVTGEKAQLDELTQPLGIFYAYHGEGDDYLVDHSSTMLLVDPLTRVHAIFSAPHQGDVLASDYVAIRQAAS